MKNRYGKFFAAILNTIALLGMLLTVGCGESEAGKALADSVKRIVGEEVSRKTDEVKKQFDQYTSQGTEKGKKESGDGSAEGSDEKESGKKSGEE